MIGKTNCKAIKQPGEYINVRLLTNQSSHSDLNGISFTVEYGGQSKDYVWDGSEVTLFIPADTEYTVKFNEVNGYRTPESVTYVAVEENARDIEALYQCELLTVNVSAYEGEVSGFEVKITKRDASLPDGYIPLEYIESTGSQYIDTGFKMNQDTRVVMKVKATSISANAWAFEGRTSNSSASKGVFFYYSSNKLWNVDYNGSSNRKSISGVAATDMLDIDYNKNVCTINGVSVTHTTATFQSSCNLTLLAANTAGTVAGYLNAKLYSCQIYDNGTLVRDFVPAKRADGLVGLYDKVNEVFYTSAGTTAFVAVGELTETIATQTTASATHKIPFGVSYTVSASGVDGFTTPASQSFTANQSVRNLSMVYEESELGVFIQGVSGKLYTESEWDSQEIPNGIAVITSNCSFVIALADPIDYCMWGSRSHRITDITTTSDENVAKTDYDGEAHTTTILNQINSSSSFYNVTASYYCRAYTFPNGKKGYLGAAGEWYAVFDNKNAIESAIIKCGGTSLGKEYWTSTQADMGSAWSMGFYISRLIDRVKESNQYVRSFAAI